MFSRRQPLPALRRLGSVFWPRSGWRRASTYIAHRIRRLPGTPYRIAAGFACGAAISFTPFIGFHFAGAALLALLLRGNVVASAIGTVIGNPWTFPFIWAWTHAFGQWLLGAEHVSALPGELSFNYIFGHLPEVFWPMTVGGLTTAVILWFAFFLPVRKAVAEYQHARRWRLQRQERKRRARVVVPSVSAGDGEPR